MSKECGMDHIDDTFGAWTSKRNRKNPDELDGIQRAHRKQVAPAEQPIHALLQAIPDVVLESTIGAAQRLRENKIDPNQPQTIPSYMTAEQIVEITNRAALYQREYDRRAPTRAAGEQKAQAARMVRESIVHSLTLTPGRIHTNGTNGHATTPRKLVAAL